MANAGVRKARSKSIKTTGVRFLGSATIRKDDSTTIGCQQWLSDTIRNLAKTNTAGEHYLE